MNVPPHNPPPAKNRALEIVLIILACLFLVGGFLSVLAIYGVRKYLAAAKSAEATSSLYEIGQAARVAYERDGKLCESSSAPIPASIRSVSAKKYQSSEDEWMADRAQNKGFACLKFEMFQPQYYQYEYRAQPNEFTAFARGDLDGDGDVATFSITGRVKDGALVLDSVVAQTPDAR